MLDPYGEVPALSKHRHAAETRGSAFREGVPQERTPLRDYLEYIAILVLIVLVLRQVVVEAFRIRHGSMAPTLVGVHNELRCPNCAWVFDVGRDKVGHSGEVECPNCRYTWEGASDYDEEGRLLTYRWPGWLWHTASASDGLALPRDEAANRAHRGPSRIFVNKFVYRVREPRRWEVVVFLYPLYSVRCKLCDWRGEFESLEDAICPDCGHRAFYIATKNFIKRVVGMPGEEVLLKGGDVYTDGSIARKPRNVQEHLWFHVFDSDFMPRRTVAQFGPIWDLGDSMQLWRTQPPGGALAVDARGSAEPVMAAYGRRIVDSYAYDGLSFDLAPRVFGAPGRHEVGDCRIRAKVQISSHDPSGAAILEVEDADHRFTFSVQAGARGRAVLEDDGLSLHEAANCGLRQQSSHWLVLENYDGRVVAKVDGREVLSHEYKPGLTGRRGVRFGARSAKVLWERIIIERDIYYCEVSTRYGLQTPCKLGDEEYFVLGDNSPASSDSRRWKHPGVPQENLVGKAFSVFWPVHQMKWLTSGEDSSAVD